MRSPSTELCHLRPTCCPCLLVQLCSRCSRFPATGRPHGGCSLGRGWQAREGDRAGRHQALSPPSVRLLCKLWLEPAALRAWLACSVGPVAADLCGTSTFGTPAPTALGTAATRDTLWRRGPRRPLSRSPRAGPGRCHSASSPPGGPPGRLGALGYFLSSSASWTGVPQSARAERGPARRGLPELLADSPTYAPVRAKSARLSWTGSQGEHRLAAVRLADAAGQPAAELGAPHAAAGEPDRAASLRHLAEQPDPAASAQPHGGRRARAARGADQLSQSGSLLPDLAFWQPEPTSSQASTASEPAAQAQGSPWEALVAGQQHAASRRSPLRSRPPSPGMLPDASSSRLSPAHSAACLQELLYLDQAQSSQASPVPGSPQAEACTPADGSAPDNRPASPSEQPAPAAQGVPGVQDPVQQLAAPALQVSTAPGDSGKAGVDREGSGSSASSTAAPSTPDKGDTPRPFAQQEDSASPQAKHDPPAQGELCACRHRSWVQTRTHLAGMLPAGPLCLHQGVARLCAELILQACAPPSALLQPLPWRTNGAGHPAGEPTRGQLPAVRCRREARSRSPLQLSPRSWDQAPNRAPAAFAALQAQFAAPANAAAPQPSLRHVRTQQATPAAQVPAAAQQLPPDTRSAPEPGAALAHALPCMAGPAPQSGCGKASGAVRARAAGSGPDTCGPLPCPDTAGHSRGACAGAAQALRPTQSFASQQEQTFEPGLRQLGGALPERLPAGEVQFYADFLAARLAGSCAQLPHQCSSEQLTTACRDGICLRCATPLMLQQAVCWRCCTDLESCGVACQACEWGRACSCWGHEAPLPGQERRPPSAANVLRSCPNTVLHTTPSTARWPACVDSPVPRSKLLNACVPESIDERALNVPDQPGNPLAEKAAQENASLCINAAKALGCAMGSVAAEDVAAGQASPPPCSPQQAPGSAAAAMDKLHITLKTRGVPWHDRDQA